MGPRRRPLGPALRLMSYAASEFALGRSARLEWGIQGREAISGISEDWDS
jgi:hypothetical protein